MKKKSRFKKFIIGLLSVMLIVFIVIVPCKLAVTVSDGFSLSSHLKDAPMMVAHRGFSAVSPENTHSAFHSAVEAGFDGYEFDLHTTKDGRWVVIHDDSVDDLTDGTGEVEDLTFEEIRKLHVDGGNGNEDYEYLAEKPTIPTFEEALYYAQEYDIIPVIEMKKCDTEYLPSMKECIDKAGLSEKAVIISFTREYLEKYREIDSECEMYLLSGSPTKEDIDWCMQHKAGINYHYLGILKNLSALSYAKKNGVKLAAWTVDNTVFKDMTVLLGADIITTNKIKPLAHK